MKSKVHICWLGKRYKKKFVCFIPFTIDGMGNTISSALLNLEKESVKIIRAMKKSNIKCHVSTKMIQKAVKKECWWKSKKSLKGKA